MLISLWFLIFIIAIGLLIYSANLFTTNAERLGVHFNIPPFIIGVTIVAIGTSLPEIITSILAVKDGHSEMIIGNVIGSNAANMLLILGITSIISGHIFIKKNIIKIDIPILIGTTLFLYISILNGVFTYKEGLIGLIILISYSIYNATHLRPKDKENKKPASKTKSSALKYIGILIISGIFLYASAELTIKSIIELAILFKVGTELITISALAIGTSLPELVVCIIAVRHNNGDLAIGNISGSSIFNIAAVMSIPSFIDDLTIPAHIIDFAMPALLGITILYAFSIIDKKISKWEGTIFIILYLTFMGKILNII